MQVPIFLTCSLLAFLTACISSKATSSPLPNFTPVRADTTRPSALLSETTTSFPSPQVVPATLATGSTPASTLTPEPIITSTLSPFPTLELPPTLAPTSIPQPSVGSGAIQFFGPGPLSKLVSPVTVYGYAIPGFDNKGNLSLFGEDGRLLASEVLQLNTSYTWAYYYWTLPFEVEAAGELARLTMSTQDQYGLLTAVYSIHLILLSEGFSIVYPPGDLKERCVIEQPAAGQRIAGGMLAVAGEIRPFNSRPLEVELVGRDGNAIVSKQVAISPAPEDTYVPFQVYLPYSIFTGSWARLVVRQPDDRIGGMMYLFSREVFLDP